MFLPLIFINVSLHATKQENKVVAIDIMRTKLNNKKMIGELASDKNGNELSAMVGFESMQSMERTKIKQIINATKNETTMACFLDSPFPIFAIIEMER